MICLVELKKTLSDSTAEFGKSLQALHAELHEAENLIEEVVFNNKYYTGLRRHCEQGSEKINQIRETYTIPCGLDV